MKVEDYMRLPKRRLAELLVEKDLQHPYYPNHPCYGPPVYTTPETNPDCYHGGPCTNPMRDCINCPRLSLTDGWITTSSAKSTATLKGNENTNP